MTPALIMIDDFLAEPEALRAPALRMKYRRKGPYPGRNSDEHIVISGLERLVSSFVHEELRISQPAESHAKFRLTLAGDDKDARIHIDPSDWSGILYLSKTEDCRGGTDFFRHLPTGTDRVPRSIEELNALGIADFDELKAIIDRDSFDRSKWEKTLSVPMRYNRLVLLQPQYWHTAGDGFGHSVEDGRLVYLMFFWRRRYSGGITTSAAQIAERSMALASGRD